MKQVILDPEELGRKTDKSERHKLADRLATKVCEFNLTQPYGGQVTLTKTGRPHYDILFCLPRHLDGLISVYSHNFIVVQYNTASRSLPPDDRRVFTNEDDVVKFLRLAFVEHQSDKALAIPVKEKK